MTGVPGCTSLANRLFAAALSVALLVGLPACKAKPSEKACEEAINNVRRITGQDSSDMGADPVAVIRSCRGNSSKESVECMRVAKTLEDLNACEGDIGNKYYEREREAAEEKMKKSDGTEVMDAAPAAVEVNTDAPASSDGGSADARAEAKPAAVTPPPEPAAEKPAAPKPAAPKPAAPKPAAPKPAASKPAASKPAASKPAASKPAASKPAAPKPAAPKPAEPKPATP